MQRIVYKQDNGVLAVIIPAPEALATMTIDEIAAKDVPTGKPYKIILTTDLPVDRTTRDFWTVADVDLTDGVGA